MAMSAGLSVNKSLEPRALRWTRARLLYLQKERKIAVFFAAQGNSFAVLLIPPAAQTTNRWSVSCHFFCAFKVEKFPFSSTQRLSYRSSRLSYHGTVGHDDTRLIFFLFVFFTERMNNDVFLQINNELEQNYSLSPIFNPGNNTIEKYTKFCE